MAIELIAGQPPVMIPVKVRRGEHKLEFNRIFADVIKANRGSAVTCANAKCVLREAAKVVPHPVYAVEFTDRRAYLVDKLRKDGLYHSCVVYDHYEGEFQRTFDTKPKGQLMKMSGVERKVTLYPPSRNLPGEGGREGRKPRLGRKNAAKETRVGRVGSKKKVVHKGGLARMERAGINVQLKQA